MVFKKMSFIFIVISLKSGLFLPLSLPGQVTSPFPNPGMYELIAAGAIWKYSDTGIYPGDNWKNNSYNDSSWKSGNAELGYGDGDEATVISHGNSPSGKNISTYFRKKFFIHDPLPVENLLLNIIRDDGAVIYLNGAEVYRTNMPSGKILPGTCASSAIGGASESKYSITGINSAPLIRGENILAVEIHQHLAKSSDISFNLKLLADTGISYTPGIFALIGDYGHSGPNEAAVASLVKSWSPEYIVTLGDNNYFEGASSTIDTNIGFYYHNYIYPYKGIYGKGADTNRFFPSLGNHDWHSSNAAPYLDYFTLPGNERYYDFVKGNIHFFCLDSDTREPDGVSDSSIQALWLKAKLSASSAKWKIVYFHHPPFASDNVHGSQMWMRWPFETWGADIVLSGHSHLYERIMINGFPYIVNGAGGCNLYSFHPLPILGSVITYADNFGAIQVKITPDTLWFRYYNVSNELIDNYPLVKNPIHALAIPQKKDFLNKQIQEMVPANSQWKYSKADFIIYPDPTTGLFTLEYCLDSIKNKTILIEICDAKAKILYTKNLAVVNSCVREVIELQKNILPGIYIMNVITDGRKESKRIILTNFKS